MSKRDNGGAPRRSEGRARPAAPGLNDCESPLAWLARRKDKAGRPLISETEFAAGERLRADFWFARLTPSVTVNWSRLMTGGGEQRGAPDCAAGLHEKQLAAQDRVRRALASAGPDLAGVLIDVCCCMKGLETVERQLGWPKRSGKLLLGVALRQLARHYGLTAEREPAAASGDRAPRISHWGAPDYRPAIEPDT